MRVIYPVTATLIKLVPLIALTFLPWLCLLTNLQRTMVAPCWLSTTTIVLFSYSCRHEMEMWKTWKMHWFKILFMAPQNVDGQCLRVYDLVPCPGRLQTGSHSFEVLYLHGRTYLVIHNRTGKLLLCLGFLVSALSPAVLLFVFHTINLPVTRDIWQAYPARGEVLLYETGFAALAS